MIYFDNAATTFRKPAEVISEMTRCMREYGGNPGRSSHALSLRAAQKIYDTRLEAAGLLGIKSPENIIFTQNCTYALNLVLSGLIRKGCHVIFSDLDHNSVIRTVANLVSERGGSYSVVSALADDDSLLESIRTAIRPDTTLTVMTHASNVIPRVLPIRRIGHLLSGYGITFVVDAAQSAGIYDIDTEKDFADVVCAPGHKGLFGPQGSGFAAFRDGFDFKRLRPFAYGGTGYFSNDISMGSSPPESFEAGTLMTPCLAGLCEGIRFVKRKGTEAVRRREKGVYSYIKEKLSAIPGIRIYYPEADSGAVLLFNIDGVSASSAAQLLSDAGICVRAGLHCAPLAHKALDTGGDAIRASFSYYNTIQEAAAFCAAVGSIAEGRTSADKKRAR